MSDHLPNDDESKTLCGRPILGRHSYGLVMKVERATCQTCKRVHRQHAIVDRIAAEAPAPGREGTT